MYSGLNLDQDPNKEIELNNLYSNARNPIWIGYLMLL